MNQLIAYICTKGRYLTTLPLALTALINQTYKPDRIVIYDDNDPAERIDLRDNLIFSNLFLIMTQKFIEWEVVFGECKGQHFGHQYFNKKYAGDFLYRCDDDVIPNPNVLENLISKMKDDVGAVGGSIIVPFWNLNQSEIGLASNKLEHIFTHQNQQWFPILETQEVDHLHCSFLYRAGIADYNLNLSKIAHREETMFTVALQKTGYKILIEPEASSWHLKSPEGGIRFGTEEMYYHDEEIFVQTLDCGKIFYLDSGLGDHIVFSTLIPELKAKYGKITLAVCYNDVFQNERLVSIDAVKNLVNPDDHNVYKWMADRNWKKELIEAYRGMYL